MKNAKSPELAIKLANSSISILTASEELTAQALSEVLLWHDAYILASAIGLDISNIDKAISELEKSELYDYMDPFTHSHIIQTLLTLRNLINYKRGKNG